MTELAGKRVLVTGAARGIGHAIARACAARGAQLVLTDQDKDTLRCTAPQVAPASHAYHLDVTDLDKVRRLRLRVLDELGPIDVLVNNAGVVRRGAFLDVPLEDHAHTFAVNTLALVGVTHVFLPDLLARPRAHLVNVASASAYVGVPRASTYAASKAAVLGFSESLREELRQHGHHHVGVTTVCPSWVVTEMFPDARAPRLTRRLTPEAVARATVRGIERNRAVVKAPAAVHLMTVMRGVLPAPWFAALARRLGVYDGLPPPAAAQRGDTGMPNVAKDASPQDPRTGR